MERLRMVSIERKEKAFRRLAGDRRAKMGAIVCAIILVAIVVVLGAVSLDLKLKQWDRLGEVHGTLEINVQSTHILADTDVTIYVDGKKIGEWKLGNLSKIQKRHECTWSKILGDSLLVNVKAESKGGHLGPTTAVKQVKVHAGGTESVTLYV